jgi:probable F420-dependent oxidoreductase
MQFSIALAFNPPEQWLALARAADEAGFHSIVVSDHLIYPAVLKSPYPYTSTGKPRWSPDTAWPDPMISIGAMAAVTDRLRFITSIYLLPLRHPVVAAKEIATVEVLSKGRLVLGIGAGWMREEFELLGVPFVGRGRRVEESVEVVRKLLRGGDVAHHGDAYDFEALRTSPLPEAPVPIWGGGTSDPALRRAATLLDGWVGEINTRDEVRQAAEKMRAWRADSDRADRPFGICTALRDGFTQDHFLEMQEVGVTQTITVPWLAYGITDAGVDRKREAIHRFADEFIHHEP